MMRTGLIVLLAVLTAVVSLSSYALEASDTMAAWKAASSQEKSRIVTQILNGNGVPGSSASMLECLDSASSVPGHSDLSIAQVASACETNGSGPV